MKRLTLVLGAGGQLGEAMTSQLGRRDEVVARTRTELNLGDAAAIRAEIAAVCPDVIINCAAYTSVDGAEHAPADALAVNATAVGALARAAAGIDAVLVHFSTDFVFDGSATSPSVETDTPNPRSVYAASKLLGEWFAAEAPRHYVLRVESLFGGARARSSVDRIYDGLSSASGEVRTFVDRTVSPSFVDDVVAATQTLLDRQAPWGLYHCVNTGSTTWTGLAVELAGLIGAGRDRIVEVRMQDAGLLANRPAYAALDNDKLRRAGFDMPTWQDALRRYVQSRRGTDAGGALD